ncbi:zinc-ribbon domain-containing protein [Streptomyces rubradiris]|uniref:zinc ribbon domain-containing protein n=1 Tax=Streptomyces rubradiris TaxID=285531 RepID=UPI0036ECE5CF
MRACPSCGASNGPTDDFCGNCGAYLGWSDSGPATSTPARPTPPDPDPAPHTPPEPDPVPDPAPAPAPAPDPAPADEPERPAPQPRASSLRSRLTGRTRGEPKPEEPKQEEPKQEEPKQEEPKPERARPEEPRPAGSTRSGDEPPAAAPGRAEPASTSSAESGPEPRTAPSGPGATAAAPSADARLSTAASDDSPTGARSSTTSPAESPSAARGSAAAPTDAPTGERSSSATPAEPPAARPAPASADGPRRSEGTTPAKAATPPARPRHPKPPAAAQPPVTPRVPSAPDAPGPRPPAAPAPEGPAPEAVLPVRPAKPVAPRPVVRPVEAPEEVAGRPCPSCGTPNPPGRRFCRRCAAELNPAAKPEPLPWWRTVWPLRRRVRAGSGRGVRLLVILGLLVALCAAGLFLLPAGRALFEDTRDKLGKPKAVTPVGIKASAEVSGHPARNTTDGVSNHYWGAPAPGASVTYTFGEPFRLIDVIITNGASKSPEAYADEARALRMDMEITTRDGELHRKRITLADKPGPQTIHTGFSQVTTVRLVLDSPSGLSPGRHLALAEVEFFARS